MIRSIQPVILTLALACFFAGDALAQPGPDGPRSPRGDSDRPPGQFDGPRNRADWRNTEPLTPEEKEKFLDFLKEFDPRMHQRTLDMIEQRPEMVDRFMPMAKRRMQDMIDLRDNDPEHFQAVVNERRLRGDVRTLVRDIREAQQAGEEAEAEQLTMQLRDKLEEHFDAQNALKMKQLEQLKQDLERMKAEIDAYPDKKDDLIDERLNDYLTGEADQNNRPNTPPTPR